jgi:hypothetical protein
VHSADVYANSDLFKSLWPKLLRASAVEACAEERKGAAVSAPTLQTVQAFLTRAEQGQSFRQDTGNGTHVIRQESADNLLFDTCDERQGNLVWHRSYLAR